MIPATKGGDAPDGRRVKGTIHWVSAMHGITCEVRNYDRLFKVAKPGADGDIFDGLNPNSLESIAGAVVEPSLKSAKPGDHFQFERKGYYFADPIDSKEGAPVFNRTVTLRDTWAKILKQDQGKKKK
jgi:glutaminyl-tRNA synthetase